jgi:hypothetical protein
MIVEGELPRCYLGVKRSSNLPFHNEENKPFGEIDKRGRRAKITRKIRVRPFAPQGGEREVERADTIDLCLRLIDRF